MTNRVFWIVLDSLGIGHAPDAAAFGDEGSHTLKSAFSDPVCKLPNLQKLGLFNIEGADCGEPVAAPTAAFCRLTERSGGKDTTSGHWEMAGLVSETPFPTYPDGFPPEVIEEFCMKTGRGALCNKPYSGTEVIKDYGEEHLKTGDLIVYTSADSVFQIAAHEDVVPVEMLYDYCQIARELLQGEHGVGRVIARPFVGTCAADFTRTPRRHDFSLTPPSDTVLNLAENAGLAVISVGKIRDIFAGSGITSANPTTGNADGMAKTLALADTDFHGICFTNLVDFDMLYGHRNDIHGYAAALAEFDAWLPQLLAKLRDDDLLLITGDHGCDPATESTDHSRERVPLLVYGNGIKPGDFGTRSCFADLGKTVADWLELDGSSLSGESFKKEITI